jgi:hypothetical protein
MFLAQTEFIRFNNRDNNFQIGFVNYKKWYNRLTATNDKVYQLLAYGRWFSPGTQASSITKTGCHDIAKILLKVALNTKNQKKNLEIQKYFVKVVESGTEIHIHVVKDTRKNTN